MNLGKWALSNSKLVYYLVAILIVGGVLSYNNISKLEDPAIRVKQAVVVTTYPGGSPSEVELTVTDPLEKAIRSMSSVDNVVSRSSADLSIITVNLLTTVADRELEQQWDLLRRKVGDVQSKLPSGSSTSVVVDDYGDVFGMFYALTCDGFSNEELSDYAQLICSQVQNISGISKVQLYGEFQSVINVSILEDKMANLGVSPVEVLQTIKGQNQIIYSGYFESGEQRIRVSVNDRYRSVEDLGNLIIKGHQGDQLRLRDVALIEMDYANPTRNKMFYDGQEAIGISISALSGTDITKLGQLVEERLEELRASRLPVGIDYHKVFFQPERVEASINSFVFNLIGSVLIVIVVLMFAMGLRSGVLLGTTLIITVVGSILFLSIFGGTLQRVSLASFILAMGMLVDNAIVIVDGILIDLGRGRPRSEALTEIGRKTAMPLLGATLIAILAFFPIFLSPDTAGIYVRDLFVVLAVSLFLSWILSLTMVPLQAKYMLKNPKKAKDRSQSKIYRALRSTLVWGLSHKTTSIVIALSLVALSGWLYLGLPQSFFPDMNYNQLYIEYKLHENNTPQKTQEDLDSITRYLMSKDIVTHVTASVGGTPSRYNLVRSIATPSIS
ncbi:MAG: efflux RND transporter permease subunit, partial [Rikenellaceae bacterium]